MAAPVPRIAIENPVGAIGTRIRAADQFVQPYDFGDDASKRTGLWLKGLPPLVIDPAKRFSGRLVEWPRGSGKMVERWSNQTDSGQNRLGPSADRWAARSVTYAGIARAMARQWGGDARQCAAARKAQRERIKMILSRDRSDDIDTSKMTDDEFRRFLDQF